MASLRRGGWTSLGTAYGGGGRGPRVVAHLDTIAFGNHSMSGYRTSSVPKGCIEMPITQREAEARGRLLPYIFFSSSSSNNPSLFKKAKVLSKNSAGGGLSF